MREKEYGIWQTYSWAQVAENVRAIACRLAELGFKRGDRLAVIGDNRPRLYWSVAACQCLGGIPVMLYQDAVAQEMAYIAAGRRDPLRGGRGPGAGRQDARDPRRGALSRARDL